MKKIVVLTGAGISAESGLQTFRGDGGLWKEHSVYELATPEAWSANPDLVLDFYNWRRKKLLEVEPNAAHKALCGLEEYFDMHIITQNVDNLHERAGSKNILHLHGELMKARSIADSRLVYDIEGWELKKGDLCEKGSQLRPHIVWFGEPVPAIEEASKIAAEAEVFVVIGTSLQVYPAAGLIDYVPENIPIFFVDPGDFNHLPPNVNFIKEGAVEGVKVLKKKLMSLI